MHRRLHAFTLVELLFALSIMAVLVFLLSLAMDKINAATASAKCISNLKTIGSAAISFSVEHNGYLPPHVASAFWETSSAERTRKAKWHWMTHLAPYLGSPDASGPMSTVFNCPSDPKVKEWPVSRPYVPAFAGDKAHTLSSYGYNYYYFTTASSWWPREGDWPSNVKGITRPGMVLVFADRREVGGDAILNPFSDASLPTPLHAGRFNAVFLDGHVQSLKTESVRTVNPHWRPE